MDQNYDEDTIYHSGAVAADGDPCSAMGVDILKRNGSAADAAIASLLCVGIVVPESTGLGGGFFLILYDAPTKESYVLDTRETAPKHAFPKIYSNETILKTGGLSIAVPGFLRGLKDLYNRFGRLPWRELIETNIQLCEKGYPVSKHLARALVTKREAILNEPTMSLFVNPSTNNVYNEGDTIVNSQLAQTLRVIQKEPDALYTGSLEENFLKDLKETGSVITREDLENYTPKWKRPIKLNLSNGNYQLHSVPPPASGIILSFILNILDNYNFNANSLKSENITTTYQRITEALKYAYAQRTKLGDSDFVNMDMLISQLTSKEFGKYIYQKILDNSTSQDPSYYGDKEVPALDSGTSHLSILAPDGSAVSTTSTINLLFGSLRTSISTGIILNDEMDDFSLANSTNAFDLPPAPADFIEPGKRPTSSMCPVIITDSCGNVRLVTGAAGGSKIISGTAQVVMNHLWFGKSIRQSIDEFRLHHQLLPMLLQYENGFNQNIISGLEDFGHNTSSFKLTDTSAVTGISRDKDTIMASSDIRKHANAYGF